MIDHYCERVGPGLLAEPANALSNLAFVVVAVLIWRSLRREPVFGGRVLVVLLIAIAIGSLAWHGLAKPWTRWLDIGALLAFQFAWLWFYTRGTLGFPARLAGLVQLAFALSLLPAATQPASTDGLLLYLPTLAALIVLGAHRRRQSMRDPNLLLGAAAMFALALALRTIDPSICATIPIGSHFAWHLLVALVAGLAMRALASDGYALRRENTN